MSEEAISKPLLGLLLTGGKSSRMGQDKARLVYHGDTPEWKRLVGLLENVCDQVYLCHRDDQNFDYSAIIDPGNGPLEAIATAQQQHPSAAWLVLACDLPLLEADTLKELVTQRDCSVDATSYASAINGLPEPLCAIYEPETASVIQERLTASRPPCPRGMLKQLNTKLIPLKHAHSLMNANTEADKMEVNSFLNDDRKQKKLSLLYFAQLGEQAGVKEEEFSTEAVTPSGLYDELTARHGFTLKQKHLMLAVNGEFASWSYALQEGDEIVFIPPVAGG